MALFTSKPHGLVSLMVGMQLVYVQAPQERGDLVRVRHIDYFLALEWGRY